MTCCGAMLFKGKEVLLRLDLASMIVRDIVVDALRMIAVKNGKVLAANVFGKLKTALQMVAIPVLLLGGWPFTYFDASWTFYRIEDILVYLATLASLFSGLFYLIKNRSVFLEGTK